MAGSSSGSLMVQRQGGVHVVEFLDTSILDQAKIEQIKDELLGLVKNTDVPKIIVSFENVQHVSSAMLGALMALHKAVDNNQGELRVAAIDDRLMEVFKLTRLDKVLKIFDTTDKALLKF